LGSKKFLIPILLLLGVFFVLFHQNLIQFAETIFAPADNRAQVGTIETFQGEVELHGPEGLNGKLPAKGSAVRHQDTLSTGRRGDVVVRMKNGMLIDVDPESSLFFEQLDYVLITFQKGSFRVLEPGTGLHDVLILKDGMLQDPEGRTLPAATLSKSETEEPEEPAVTPAPAPGDEKTLSDSYISTVVQNQRGFLNHCYALHLRNQPQSKGEIDLTFTIQTGGDVTNLKILKSTLPDSDLQKCILSVIERTRFKRFEGDPIIVNYPIFFE
jgi:TonB family protein